MGHGSLKSSVAGFCWLLEIASVCVRCCWVSGLLRLVMGLVEIGVGHSEVMARLCVVEIGVDSDGFCYGFQWPSLPRSLTPHRFEFLGYGLILWVYGVGLWLILDCGLWMVL